MILNKENFKKEVLENSGAVVVDFYADWCMPCKMYTPIFENLAVKFTGKVKFAKLNIDSAMEIANEYGVMSIPLVILFKNGKVAGTISGLRSEQELQKWITEKII